MKYFNIKRNKFSTIFKNINFKRYERILANVAEFVIFIIEYVFSRIYRKFNYIRHHFLKTYNKIDGEINENRKIGIYMSGLSNEEHFSSKSKIISFFDIYNTINKIMIQANILNYKTMAGKSKILDECVELEIDKKTICTIGKVKKELLNYFEINQDVYFAELEWNNFINNLNNDLKYIKILYYL